MKLYRITAFAALALLLAVLTGCGESPKPGEPSASVQPAATAEPTAEVTAEPTPKATAAPTAEPTAAPDDAFIEFKDPKLEEAVRAATYSYNVEYRG